MYLQSDIISPLSQPNPVMLLKHFLGIQILYNSKRVDELSNFLPILTMSSDNPGVGLPNNSVPNRPFSDSTDIICRLERTRAECLAVTATELDPGISTELEVREITEAFKEASLASPEVCLVIASLN